MKELVSLLNNIHPLSPLLQQYLVEKLQPHTILKKEYLSQAGQVSRRIYLSGKDYFVVITCMANSRSIPNS